MWGVPPVTSFKAGNRTEAITPAKGHTQSDPHQKLEHTSVIISKIPKTSSSLIPSQFLATTAVQRSGDHVKLWTAERFVSLAQIPALIVPFVWTNFGTDVAFCNLAVLHSHWGKLHSVLKRNSSKIHENGVCLVGLCV